MSAFGGKGDIGERSVDVRLLTQSGHPGSAYSCLRPANLMTVDVTHGLVLLFGIGTRALPAWDSKTRWNDLSGDLADRLSAGPSGDAAAEHQTDNYEYNCTHKLLVKRQSH
jgi:hypothetical protein